MKKHLILKQLSLLFSLFLVVMGGCSVAPVAEDYYTPYTSGTLQGKGIRIEAEDGSFVINEGRFTPSFQSYQTHGSHSLAYAVYFNGTRPVTALIDSFDLALKHGAKKVRIYHPATKQALYGVLLLNKKMTAYATGPAARSYLIRIPDSYVDSAKGGRVSVVYEPVSVKNNAKGKLVGWALWLSDAPF